MFTPSNTRFVQNRDRVNERLSVATGSGGWAERSVANAAF
jgi:hypothetical protein